MVQIPPNECTQEDLIKWFDLAQQLKKLKNAEMLLRTKIFKHKFPDPVEGTNKSPLANGYELVGKHSITRKLDEPMLDVLLPEFVAAHINVAAMIRRKPELNLSAYRELTAEQQNLFDRALIITPGSPSLEIVLPASAKPKKEQ